MVSAGDRAPQFTLPGTNGDGVDTYSLSDAMAEDRATLLVFYPFDFSPVCTNELCAIRDAEWFQFTPAVSVWAISGDSVYAHRAFAEEYNLDFPLLSDSAAAVAEAYDVRYEEWENHEDVPQRAVILVDREGTVRYAWDTDDAFEKPDFFPVKEAADELTDERDDLDTEDVELDVEYPDGPGEIV